MDKLSDLQQQAAVYLSEQKYSEATSLYEQCIAATPTVMANYWSLGLALLLQGKEAEAQFTWLSAMAEGDTEEVEAKKAELIDLLAAEAQKRKAVRDFQSAWIIHQYIWELAPENFNNLLSIILLSIQLETFQPHGQMAILQATQLVLAENFTSLNYELLIQVLDTLLIINPENEFIEVCLFSKNLITDYQMVVTIKNKLAKAHDSLGFTVYKQNNFAQATNHFQKILDIKPELTELQLATIHFNLGMALVNQGKLDQAVGSFQKVLEMQAAFGQPRYEVYKARNEIHNILKGYQFSTDWFTRNIEIWEQNLSRFANAHGINMLEIGSWEGRSTCWLLDNILTHDSARITCVDTFAGSFEHKEWYEDSYLKSIEERFDFNISRTNASEKVQKIVGNSQKVMRALMLNSYDIVYIDGSHLAKDVLADALLCWDLVKVGGTIIFDDYDFILADKPAQNTKNGIDPFLTLFCDNIKVIHKSHQVIIEKTTL